MFVIVLGCAGQLCRLRIRGIVAIMEPDENLIKSPWGKKTKRNSGELFFEKELAGPVQGTPRSRKGFLNLFFY